MADKISAKMATSIGLDTVGVVESLKNVQKAVKLTASSWKAMEAIQKNAGDYMNAAKSRYDGLGKQIDLVRQRMERLKAQQDKLKQADGDNSSQLAKLQEAYNKAAKQMATLEKQQESARQKMSYYTSGLAKLQSAYRSTNNVSQSTIDRLEAEGKSSEAAAVKQKTLASSVDNLTKQYKIQASELDKVAKASGESSEAYARQKIRLNQTATALAHAKNELGGMQAKAKENTGIRKLSSSLSNLTEKAQKTGSTMGKFIGANLISSGIQNGLSFIKSHLTGIITTGVAANKAVQGVQISMLNASGGSKKLQQQMVNMFSEVRGKSGYAADTVTLLTKKTTAWADGNEQRANKLAMSFVTLGRALGMNDGKLQGLITKFGTLNASGSVTSASLTKMERQLPGFSAALEKTMGKSRDKLNDMASKGKLSMQDLQNAMITMADSKKNGLDNYYKTWDGFTTHFQLRYAKLSGLITSGIFGKQSNFLASLSKSLDGADVENAFTKLGNSISKSMNTIFSAFGSVFKGKGENPLASVVNAISDAMVKLANNLAKNKGQIIEMAKGVKSALVIMGTFAKTMAGTLVPVLNSVATAIGKHPKLISGVILGYAGLSKVILPVTGGMLRFGIAAADFYEKAPMLQKALTSVGNGFKSMMAFMFTNPWGIALTAIAAIGTAFVVAYNKSKSFRNFINSIGKTIANSFKGIPKIIGGIGKTIGSVVNVFGKAFSHAVSSSKKGGQNVKKGFLNGVKGISTSFAKTIDGIAKWTNKIKLGDKLRKIAADAGKHIGELVKSIGPKLSSLVKSFSSMLNSVARTVKALYEKLKPLFKVIGRIVWVSIKNGLKTAVDLFRDSFKVIGSLMNVFTDLLTGKWGRLGKDIKKLVGNMWHLVKNLFKNAFNWLNDLTGGALGRMVKWFATKMRAIVTTISNIVGAVRHAMVGVVRAALRPFNSLLDGLRKGINWVISKFGASPIKSKWEIPLPAYAKGTPGAHKGGFALVNDAKSSRYREMYKLPNGKVGLFPKQRNLVVNLPKGTEVLDGENTAKLIEAAGIPAYKDGIFSKIGGFASSIFKKGVDLVENTAAILAHPIKFMEKVFQKFLGSGLGKAAGFMGDIIAKVPSTVASWAVKWVKNLVNSFGDAGGSAANPKGASITRWRPYIKRALSANGLPTSAAYVNSWLRQIKTESGGNPNARQPGADPDGDGSGPALGLVQTKRSTFMANAFSGHKNIFNGYDNLLAGIRYAKRTYGSRMLSVIGAGHGYANGGLVTKHQVAEIAEGNLPEMVIPLDESKRGRGWELLGQTYKHFTNGKQATQQSAPTTDYTALFKDMLTEMQAMNARLQRVEQAQYATALTANDVYNANRQVAYQKQRINNTAFN